MKIFVTVKPNAKRAHVNKIDATHYAVSVSEAPHEGRANKAVADAFARQLGVAKSRVKIISGAKSKQKVLEVL